MSVNYGADAFVGTAPYYAKYRVAYPEALVRDLLVRAGVGGDGMLLDLGCGPGRVALALADSFRETWAVDPEPEMLEVGRQEAAKLGVNRVRWILGRAEELEAPAESFELVTVGAAFHRLDQEVVSRGMLRWLKPGGWVALMGDWGITSGKQPWQIIVRDTVIKWTGRVELGTGAVPKGKPEMGPEHDEGVLREAGFVEVASFPFLQPHEWTVRSILGYLYSTSVCSRRVLGAKADGFEADLTAALIKHDAGGIYREQARFGYTLGRKAS